MNDVTDEMDGSLTLGGNAIAGLLEEIFGTELTGQPCDCAHCGNHADVGSLRTFTLGPGVTLRRSICGEVMIRVVQTPDAIYLDMRGAASLRMSRPTA